MFVRDEMRSDVLAQAPRLGEYELLGGGWQRALTWLDEVRKVKPEDIISIKSGSGATETVQRATELVSTVPAWLQADHDALTAKVLRLPERAEISAPVQEQLIVELYSK